LVVLKKKKFFEAQILRLPPFPFTENDVRGVFQEVWFHSVFICLFLVLFRLSFFDKILEQL
jgi:hypothetical protein